MKKRSLVYPAWIILTIIFVIVALVFLLFFLYNYKTEKTAKGFEDEVYVVADSVEYEQFVESLRSVFEKEINTPQPEKLFTLKRMSVAQFEKNQQAKNIIIAAPLNSVSRTSDYIKVIVDKSIETKLESDSNFIDYKNDLWARNQLVAVISAPTIDELNTKILNNSDVLLNQFQKKSDERLFSNLYNPKYEKKNIEAKFLSNYGWVIYVQTDYMIALDNPEENFVWLKKSTSGNTEISIFVYWIEDGNTDYLVQDSIKAIRNRLTKKFYLTSDDTSYIVVAENQFVVNEVNFNGKYALFTQGLWKRELNGMEGPFVNYFFYDEVTQRIYMIDGSVYAPKYYNRNLIQQVDVTLQSFRTRSELPKERIEELLDAID